MHQFPVLLLTILFLLGSTGCGAGQVLGPTLTPTLTSTATPTLTPTATATPTPTTIPTPSVAHGLRSENAATQTYENGTWVVKNADGQVTATWNEQTKGWTYDMETIKIQQILEDGNPFFPPKELAADILARPPPPDDPSTHFIDPNTHEPLGYGTFKENTRGYTNKIIGEYIQHITYISVRVRGCYENEYGNPYLLLSYPNGPDLESIVSYYIGSPLPLAVFGLSNTDLAGNIEDYYSYRKVIPDSSMCNFLNGEAFGKQALVEVWHDLPVGYFNETEEYIRESNKGADEVIAFLNGSEMTPKIKYDRSAFQDVLKPTLIFPQEESGPITID